MLERVSRRRTGLAASAALALSLAWLLALAPAAGAAVPGQVNYQGLLLDDAGVPVDGSADFDFALFDAPTAGTLLWSETHTGVAVIEGVYEVALGSLTPIDASLLEGGALYLEITVGTDTLAPRQRLLAVPYALRADVAETTLAVGTVPQDFVTQLYLHTNFDGGPPNDDPQEGFADTDGDGAQNFIDDDNDDDGRTDSEEIVVGSDINLITPRITSVVPPSANNFVTTTLDISGHFFEPGMVVEIGGQTPVPYDLTSTSLKVDVGPQNPASETIVLTRVNLETATRSFTFSCGPSLTSVLPETIENGVLTPVHVSGANLVPGFALQLGPYSPTPTNITPTGFDFEVQPTEFGPLDLSIDYGYGCSDTLPGAVTAVLGARTIFVTSTTHTGALGGLAGADAICQTRASAAGLPGTYIAWLSDSSQSPAARSTQKGPYRTRAGVTVANDWADLTDGTLLAPIDRSESNLVFSSGTAWTNTLANGSPAGSDHCSDWTSGVAGPQGHYGTLLSTTSTWTDAAALGCQNPRRLYCVEQ